MGGLAQRASLEEMGRPEPEDAAIHPQIPSPESPAEARPPERQRIERTGPEPAVPVADDTLAAPAALRR